MSRYPQFDRQRLDLKPLAERGHELVSSACQPLEPPPEPFDHPEFPELVARIVAARKANRPVVLMMGAHPIKLGLSRFIIDLIERGMITHFATNGAGLIHDFELALVGGTSEDVSKWIQVGQFGLWQETAKLNDVIREAGERGEGLGEAGGRVIAEGRGLRGEGQGKDNKPNKPPFLHPDLSIAAACWRTSIPCTCHVSVGSDIIHGLPNCDGAALGQTSFTDFLIFTHSIGQLEGGVFLNVGSAVTGPEVYLKALSMARNVARQEGREIRHFTTAVFDLVPLPDNYRDGTPSKSQPGYYYRPWKTILIRTVADGGQSFFFCGDHRQTIPTLWQRLASQTELITPHMAQTKRPWANAHGHADTSSSGSKT